VFLSLYFFWGGGAAVVFVLSGRLEIYLAHCVKHRLFIGEGSEVVTRDADHNAVHVYRKMFIVNSKVKLGIL
jgi:hypothetical protein